MAKPFAPETIISHLGIFQGNPKKQGLNGSEMNGFE